MNYNNGWGLEAHFGAASARFIYNWVSDTFRSICLILSDNRLPSY